MKEENYKSYKIEIHSQLKTGDNIKLYFGVWKNNDKIFGIWEQISGTEMRSMNKIEVIKLLEIRGMERIKQMIDDNGFEENSEYKYWEPAN